MNYYWMAGPEKRKQEQEQEPVRVGDLQRLEMTGKLSKYFQFGYITQEEFSVLTDKALAARWESDLAGLLQGLPPLLVTVPTAVQERRRAEVLAEMKRDHRFHKIMALCCFAAYVIIILTIIAVFA